MSANDAELMEVDDDQPIVKRKIKKHYDDFADDSDDETLLEMDVVVCEEVPQHQFFRIQFPQRKKEMFSNESRTRCRYKKNVKMLEVRVAIDPNNGSFDKNKIAENDNGATRDAKTVKKETGINNWNLYNVPQGITSEEVYEGRAFSADVPLNYAVGFIKNGTFYISQLDGNFNLNRSLDHMNDRKTIDKDFEEEASAESDSDVNQPVRVKFKRPETDRQKQRREASALHREKQIASDTWVPLDVFLQDEPVVRDKMATLIPPDTKCKNGPSSARDCEKLDLKDIVTQAILKREVEQLDLTNCNQSQLALQQILDLPSHLQVKALMLKARVISTSSAESLLPHISKTRLIELLQGCAHIVQGNWVLDSDSLFQKLPSANSHGLGKIDPDRANLWRAARDLALAMIDSEVPVTREALSSIFDLSMDDLQEILSTFGYVDLRERSWKLTLKRNNEFFESSIFLHLFVENKKFWNDRWSEILAQAKKKKETKNDVHSASAS